jgi:hypothetical protein
MSIMFVTMSMTAGCTYESKVQQLQRGAELVDAHAKAIEDAAKYSDGHAPSVDNFEDASRKGDGEEKSN